MRKLLTIFAFAFMLSIATASAFEWDNVKSYDETAKEVTITNALGLGDVIAKVKLDTPLVVYVMAGENRKVAEYTINLLSDEYAEPIKEIELYSGNSRITRAVTYKVKSYADEEIEVPVYKKSCKIVNANATFAGGEVCQDVIDSYEKKIVQKEVWNNIDTAKLTKGTYTIGIYTDVERGDNVEWIPNLFGIKVEEWATWTDSFNVGLMGYYKMDNNESNIMIDSTNQKNGTLPVGNEIKTTQKVIGNSSYKIWAGASVLYNSTISPTGTTLSFNYWFNSSDFTGDAGNALNPFLQNTECNTNPETNGMFGTYGTGSNNGLVLRTKDSASVKTITTSNDAIINNKWNMITYTFKTDEVKVYVNGILNATTALSAWSMAGGASFEFLRHTNGACVATNGKVYMDEMGIWNRTLTASEITDLYNGGAGITYSSEPPASPLSITITLKSPANGSLIGNNSTYTHTNATITNGNLTNVTMWLYNSTKGEISHCSLEKTGTFNSSYAGCAGIQWREGINYWQQSWCGVNATDTLCKFSSENYTIDVDTISPVVNWTNVSEADIYTNGNTCTYNITIVDAHRNSSYIRITNTTGYYTLTDVLNTTYDQTGASSLKVNFTLADGWYSVSYWANDSLGRTDTSTTGENGICYIDTITPSIQYNPATTTSGTYQNSTTITINVSSYDYNSRLGATIYSWLHNSTDAEINYTTNYTLGKDGTLQTTYTGLPDGIYYYNASVIDFGGNPGNTNWTELRNVTIDTIVPVITMTTPLNENYWIKGTNMSINWTISDANKDSCWIIYNAVTYPVTCSKNTTSLNMTNYAIRNLTFYANDSAGNINSAFKSWNYTIFQNSLSYNTSSDASSLEGFIVNISYDSSVYSSSVTGILRYNNTDYATTQAGDLYYVSLATPAVSVVTNVSFNWNFTLVGSSTASVVSPSFLQELKNTTGILVSAQCPAGLNASIIFTFKIETNNTPINATANYNLKYGIYTPDAYTINGTFTNVANFSICINSSNPTYQISYGEVQYSTTGYDHRRFYLFTGTRATATTIANNLYLLPSGDATSFQIEVLKNDLTALVNYYTTLLRWYPDINQYNVVEMGKTDEKGQTINKVVVEDVDYRIGIYTSNGTLIKLLDPVRMVCLTTPCEYSIFINLDEQEYTSFSKIQSSLTFNDTTKIFKFVWNDPTQVTTAMNLTIYKGDNIVCSSSATGFTGIITCDVTGQTGTLKGVAYRSASPQRVIASIWATISTKIKDIADGTGGLLMASLLSVTLALIGIWSPVASVVLGILGLIPAYFLGGIPMAVGIGFGLLGGLVVWTIIKRSG